jgi:hypothetical protein
MGGDGFAECHSGNRCLGEHLALDSCILGNPIEQVLHLTVAPLF